jgi:hypothetical protein
LAEADRRLIARRRCYPPAVKLYEPLNVLKPVGADLWVVDGPVIRGGLLGGLGTLPDTHGRRAPKKR